MKTFLKAEWRNLILANYAVDPAILQPFLPAGTVLDFWQDTCYVSLVGFRFVNTKVLNMAFPFHRNFTEVNLRFYVKHRSAEGDWRRGVVFISEIVPLPAITFIANTLYNENYSTKQMRHKWLKNNFLNVVYEWKHHYNWHHLSAKGTLEPTEMPKGSEAEFITEHYWGYAKINVQKTMQYQVEHPRWRVHEIKDFNIEVDFKSLYGATFGILNEQAPRSVFMAEGSAIQVKKGQKIE